MAVNPPRGKLVTRRPSLKGVVMQDVSQGQERVRAWPRKRGTTLHDKTKAQMEWFRQAQWATKYMDPQMLIAFANATKRTPLLPRDLATMMFAGRMMWFYLPNGKKMFSMQARADVSLSLDAIGQTPGTTLIRGTDEWEVQPPVIANRVGAIVTRAAATPSIASGAAGVITWTTEQIDQGSFWTPAAPTRLTIPLQGWYQMIFQSQRSNGGNFTSEYVIRKNGTPLYGTRFSNPNSAAGPLSALPFFDYANAGDYYEFQVTTYGVATTWVNSNIRIIGNA